MTTLAFTYLILLNCFLGALFARMDGGAPPKTNEWVERLLSISFACCACIIVEPSWWSLTSLLGIFGLATGHGQFFPNMSIKAISPEKTDFIVRLFFDQDPRTKAEFVKWRGKHINDYTTEEREKIRSHMTLYGLKKLYWRCLTGMSVTGLMFGLPSAIYLAFHGHYIFSLMALSTFLWKPLSYAIGNHGYIRDWKTGIEHLEWGTEISEACYGFLRTLAFLLIILLSVNIYLINV